MSLSKGTAQAIVPRRTDATLTVSLSTDKIDGGSAGSTPPDRSLTAKPSSEAVHDLVAKGNVSRSNSMQDIQHVQHELKSAGELVFATDASNSPTLKGGNFLKLVEWMLASASPEERALQNFVLAYRQWKPPAELWRIVMDKYVSLVLPHVARSLDGVRFDAQKTADKSDFHRKRYAANPVCFLTQMQGSARSCWCGSISASTEISFHGRGAGVCSTSCSPSSPDSLYPGNSSSRIASRSPSCGYDC